MTARPVVGIIGLGRMGRGMAHAFAYTGHDVRLIDLKPREPEVWDVLVAQARGEIDGTLSLVLDAVGGAGRVGEAIARISFHPEASADPALAGCDFVFECIPEIVELKRQAFRRIAAATRPGTILASTTSTILVDDIGNALDAAAASRFLNIHWLNPAFLIPLVEISPSDRTSPEIILRAEAMLALAGKKSVRCRPAPGYLVPRIQALAMNEAARIVSAGIATAEDVDTATRLGFGLRFAILGLIEFIDWGGGDILFQASEYLATSLGDERYRAPEIIRRNMAEGATGVRAGRGFHDYADRDIAAYQRETLRRLIGLLEHLGLMPPLAASDAGGGSPG